MRSPYVLALMAMLFVAVPYGCVGRFFRHISSEVTTTIFYAAGLVALGLLGLVAARLDSTTLTWPGSWWHYAILALFGIMLGLGDFFAVKALNGGGSTMMVVTMITLMPCVAAAIDVAFGGQWPSLKMWLGWGFAAVATILIRGDPPPEPVPAPTAIISVPSADAPPSAN